MSQLAPSDTIPRSPASGGGDALWVLYTPCGCRCGWTAVHIPGKEPLLTEDMVWDHTPYGDVHQARMRSLGFRWVLLMADDENFREEDCPHRDPFVPDVWITLDGHTWAAAEMTATVEHLVPLAEADLVEFGAFGCVGAQVTSLCGEATGATWWGLNRADPCPDCEAVARTMRDGGSGAP